MENGLTKIIDIDNAEHYNWGDNCDGWHLLKNDKLSIIQERMPSKTLETLHLHNKSQQFFFIVKGIATFEIENTIYEIREKQGIHVSPQLKHRIINNTSEDLHFIVISEPKSHGDRINV